MESSVVRKRVREAIESARHGAAARRAANDAAGVAWQRGRETVVVPVRRQAAQILRSEGYLLQVSTPGDSVRVSLEKAPQDGVELLLDTTGAEPVLLLRVTRSRGRQTTSDERVVANGATAIEAVTEEQACDLLLSALSPMFER
jgi:hypothetical protein